MPTDTGAVGGNYKTVKRAAGPFNGPTDVAFGPGGELYVSDGYANARIHRFSVGGKLLGSWGAPGDRPGEFCLPHGALVGHGKTLYVMDRENNRVQLFSLKGEFISQWMDFAGPTGISDGEYGNLVLCEFGYDPAAPTKYSVPAHGRKILPRVTIRSPEGELLGKIEGEHKCATGSFFAPHSICVDAGGDIYVGEVPITRRAPEECHALQKLVKR